jgi:hypothetical protein
VLQFAHDADPSLAPPDVIARLHLTVPAPAATPSAGENAAPPPAEGSSAAVVPAAGEVPTLPPHVTTLTPAQFQPVGPKIETPASASPAGETAASAVAASPAAVSPSPSASVGAQ